MQNLYNTLIPIFAIVLLGYALVYFKITKAEFWKPLENITYFALLPALMVNDLVKTPLRDVNISSIAMTALGGIIVVSSMLIVLWPMLKKLTGAEFSSIFQGSIRFNSYIAMAVAHALNPQVGVALVALMMAIVIPSVNVLSVIVLEHYATHTPTSWVKIVKSVLKNPLVLSCVLGLILNRMQVSFTPEMHQTLKILGGGALPLGLLVMGAGLQLSTIKHSVGSLALSSLLKLIILPILTWELGHYIGIETDVLQIIILVAALPTATTSYILARQMGGDHVLMANIITLETIVSIFSLPWMLVHLT